MSRVQIRMSERGFKRPEVIVDGQKIQHVSNVELKANVQDVPTVTVNVVSYPDVEIEADVIIQPTPLGVQDACKVLVGELKKTW